MVYKRVPKKNKICRICNKEFTTHRSNQICCSKKCSSENEKRSFVLKPYTTKNIKCKYCGKDFLWKSSRPNKEYCNKECVKENAKMKRGFKKKRYVKYCIICNKEFVANHPNKINCSKECADKGALIYSKKMKNGLIIHGGVTSGFYKLRFAVFTRDNFTCQYCGRTVFEDKIKLHADHIFPKSKGGEFIMKNMITSCEECNLGKSDILLEERLIQRFKESISNTGMS